MYVIGTAGHVDHGKSTLVKALTDIDPDRFPEEKAREMTIDLGFAWMTLPSGREVSIVDVPGHERFIKNMLAGVGAIDLALLIVAADESVMPQTREHLAILDILQITRGLVVVTKTDLVDDELVELVKAEVEDTLIGTSFEGCPMVGVSAYTSDGMDELEATMDRILDETEARKDLGRPRLPIDRCFTISGFGTVVTGTLIDGTLTVGQEVELAGSGQRARIRGLQSHKTKVDATDPGVRLAVNLSGLSRDEVERGEILTIPGWLRPTRRLDVRLRMVKNAPHSLKHNEGITFHLFTSESPARVRLLGADRLAAGEEGWVQLLLSDPLPVVKGDFFVIRSSEDTLGGGQVVDPNPRRRYRRFDDDVVERLMTTGPRHRWGHHHQRRRPVGTLRCYGSLSADQPAEGGSDGKGVPIDPGRAFGEPGRFPNRPRRSGLLSSGVGCTQEQGFICSSALPHPIPVAAGRSSSGDSQPVKPLSTGLPAGVGAAHRRAYRGR